MYVRNDYLRVLVLLGCNAAMTGAQGPAPQLSGMRTGQPPSVKQRLAEHGIRERAQVVQALVTADPELRSLAASLLVGERDPEAAALIRKALSTEQNPTVIVTFATELWALDVPEGQVRLEAFCRNAPSRDTLILAAEQLSFRHKGGLCARALVDDYRTGLTSGQLLETLSLLQSIASDVTPEDKIVMSRLADEESSSPDLHVRVEARHLSRELR